MSWCGGGGQKYRLQSQFMFKKVKGSKPMLLQLQAPLP
jgi:hypothetical protein